MANLTSAINAMIAAAVANPSACAIGTYQVPVGHHTVDLNSIVVPPAPLQHPGMSYTLDSNFAIIGDPCGGSYISPTADVPGGVMFTLNGGRCKFKDVRFVGASLERFLVIHAVGDKVDINPQTRNLVVEDCEFVHCSSGIRLDNYENAHIERNRFEVDRDRPEDSPDAAATTHILSANGSQNLWIRDNDYLGGQGIWITDTYDVNNPTAGWPSEGHFIGGENMVNMWSSLTIEAGLCYLITGCLFDTYAQAGNGVLVNPAPNKGAANISLAACWIGGNAANKFYALYTTQVSLVGCQIQGAAGSTSTGIRIEQSEDITFEACQIHGGQAAGGLDVFVDPNTEGVQAHGNVFGSPQSIAHYGLKGNYTVNRIKGPYAHQTAGSGNSYGVVTG